MDDCEAALFQLQQELTARIVESEITDNVADKSWYVVRTQVISPTT